jgi:CheY-like chemotaxis protein
LAAPRVWSHTRSSGRGRSLSVEQGQLRVLIVDDDADACDILAHVMNHLGHSVECVQDAVQALPRLLREHFDVVLLDLVMPGLSGFDLLRATQVGVGKPMAVIAVSSYSEFRYKAGSAGFHAFVEKPVELSKLRPVLEGLTPGT